MMVMTFKLLGGIGLFLIGMILMTDGLKSFAGEALRKALVRFTGTPLKAFGSGVLVTLMVQSSTATTVTLIGFVSAGLLTFPQAVGVVFGASLGTTGTGWIISVLGLKVSLGFYVLPLIGFGAFAKLLARGRWGSFGLALAGFALIFVGIDTLQDGMQSLSNAFDPASLPSAGLGGRALVMLVGILLTVIMQSSTAVVATTLTALHTAAINFEQAAVLVVGAAIGTTVTGALAAIGGSVSAKRTALAHVLFNLLSGLIALALLPILLWGLGRAQATLGLAPGATSLAAFHTTFIALGVVIFLPLVKRFSRVIERVLPDEGPRLTRHLDNTLLQVPAVALETTARTLTEIACELFDGLGKVVSNLPGAPDRLRRDEIKRALQQTQEFLVKIPASLEAQPLFAIRMAKMHAIEHLIRLHARLRPPGSLRQVLIEGEARLATAHCLNMLDMASRGLRGQGSAQWLSEMEVLANDLGDLRREERLDAFRKAQGDSAGAAQALDVVGAVRWLDRVGHHCWRICHHLAVGRQPVPVEAPASVGDVGGESADPQPEQVT